LIFFIKYNISKIKQEELLIVLLM